MNTHSIDTGAGTFECDVLQASENARAGRFLAFLVRTLPVLSRS
jgi:hypothetical protein